MSRKLEKARLKGRPVCPMCLTLWGPGRTDGIACPECRTSGRPVPLMERDDYLQTVDLGIVQDFWANVSASDELRKRMLERVEVLRRLKEQGG